jgi:flagellar hook-associated protein 1
MSLIGALDAGTTALAAQQASIQVVGNNLANAANPNYDEEQVTLTETPATQYGGGISIGDGVDLTAVQRQVDNALNERLRSSMSDNSSSTASQTWLAQVESAFNALSGQDVGSQMDTFLSSWSQLANNPTDTGQRQVVLQDGQTLASSFQSLSGQLDDLQSSINTQLAGQTNVANGLAQQVATLNEQIAVSEAGTSGQNNTLRDQRDAALAQLSQLMNISTQQQPDGEINVYVGSEPLVEGSNSRGVSLKTQSNAGGNVTPTLIFTDNNGTVPVTGGQLGGLISVRSQISAYQGQVNSLAGNLIFELNKLHSSGQGTSGYSSVTATNAVTDPTQALNNPAAGLDFTPTNGSFVVHVTNTATGLSTSTLVQVNLTGSPGDTTLNSLTASLSGIPGVTASITGGKLTIASASPDQQISFSQDSSGTLAALGINTFFTGSNAGNINVNDDLTADPSLLAAAQNGDSGDNQTALAIANLGSASIAGLGGQSLTDSYQGLVTQIGTDTAAAATNQQAAQTVQQTLQAQQSSVSGVSINEELVNMIQQQQGFAAASRLVSAVNTMMQQIIQMI